MDEEIKTVAGFKKQFGEPKETMLVDLTQKFISTYHRHGVDPIELVEGFGIDWVQLLMKYNEEVEEYELCAIFRDLIKDYKQK
jgi:thiamine monophosphate synthase